MGATVRTAQGRVRGFVDDGAHAFLGLPYAAPPLGPHRFAAPAAPEGWDGVREATAFGPTAPQRDPGATIIPEPVERGDDFLNLNVYTPDPGAGGLPVLVWIHGGGFVSGCNRSPWYRGTRFARDGVVLVSIGYRLGAEGFLRVEDAPSNRAVLDWIAGLEWVRNNISSFGGDPDCVTIGGQSAGSAACLTLLTNARARGLFSRVIAMSGTSDTRMPPEAAAELARRVAEHHGVRPTREELSAIHPDVLVETAAAVASNPFDADAIAAGFDSRAPALKPFLDGEVIAEHPYKAIAAGVGSNLPLLAGATAEELNAIGRLRIGSQGEDAAVRVLAAMGLDGERLDRYATHVGSASAADLVGQAMTDRAFRAPLAALLEDRAASGATSYAYEFRWRSPVFDGAVGACHCLDLPFVFDNLDAPQVADGMVGAGAPQDLADRMHSAWVRFIAGEEPGWPAYESERRACQAFDVSSQVVEDPWRVQRELFT